MRLDSQHPGYLQDDSRLRDVDPSQYAPPLPEVAAEVQVLVDGDFVDGYQARGAGMAPFFGLDGVEPPPPREYEIGFDGPGEVALRYLAPAGPEVDGVNARGAAFARLLITGPIGSELDNVAPHRRTPALAASSFHPGDALEPRLAAAARTGVGPQLGRDGVGLDPPGFDVRQPIVGADAFEDRAAIRRPAPSPVFTHAGDGMDLARRPGRRAAA